VSVKIRSQPARVGLSFTIPDVHRRACRGERRCAMLIV
jgi:hypothetical protein